MNWVGVLNAADCRLDVVDAFGCVQTLCRGAYRGIGVYQRGSTKKDWFYNMEADEFSLDDKRTFTDGKGVFKSCSN